MSGFFNQGDTRLSLDGDWDVDNGLRIVAMPSGRKFIGLASAGTGEPVSGVGLHAESHYGDDALDIDQIPGTLDAEKLFGTATLGGLDVSGIGTIADLRADTLQVGDAVSITGSGVDLSGVSITAPLQMPVGAPMVTDLDAQKLGGQLGAFYLASANHTGTRAPSAITGGTAGRFVRDNGTVGAWSTATMPDTVAAGDLLYGSATNVWSARSAVAAGSFLRSAGVATAPVWSTLSIPNAATAGNIVYATGADAWGGLANPGGTSVLTHNGTVPSWASALAKANQHAQTAYLDAAQTFAAVQTFGADVVVAVMRRGTSDGADNSQIEFCGGGAVLGGRGARAQLYGNEHATNPGDLRFHTGAVAGGTVRFYSGTGGAERWNINPSGHLIAATDNAVDIGATGATRPRDLFLARKAEIGGELEVDGAFNHDGSTAGFFGGTPATKPTVTGSRAGNAALASLLTGLASLGLLTDSSTA